MRWWFRSAIVGTLASLCTHGAIAQESDDIARLEKALEAQQALNQRLLERLEALEGAQAATLETIQAMARSMPAKETIREQREAMFEEFRDDYFDLQDRLDGLPTLSGYYDFEYFNDDRSDSPGEFRQHHLSLHLTKEWDK